MITKKYIIVLNFKSDKHSVFLSSFNQQNFYTTNYIEHATMFFSKSSAQSIMIDYLVETYNKPISELSDKLDFEILEVSIGEEEPLSVA